MPSAEQAVLDVGRSQIGVRETPVNRQKYGSAYGANGVAWCQQFAWWVMREAGCGALVPKSASTIATYDWFKQRGQAPKEPRPGDLVFFNWRDGSRAWPMPQHVGIVEHVNSDGSLTTLEGNTQTGTSGNQSDGGGVWRRARAASPYVVGYGRPLYSAAPPPLPDMEDDLMPAIPILPDNAGRFHESCGAEVGGGSRVAQQGWVTWGSAWGATSWTVAALAESGVVLDVWKDVPTPNNCSTSRQLPDGTRAITVEGQIEASGTRPWASAWFVR